MATTATALETSLNLAGPQTDDELWEWIHDTLGYNVPRVSVCNDHVSPFRFLADVYFERTAAAVAIANRGGSKTFLSALLMLLFSKFKKGCESACVGAVEHQALRCYRHFQELMKLDGGVGHIDDHPDIVGHSNQRETNLRNGSKNEVLVGTMPGVNGPHPQKLGTDEVELMDPAVYDESRNMTQSKNGIMAQDWIISTRKRAHGPMQSIVDEINDATNKGMTPPYDLYLWCVFESAATVANCQNGCGCDKVAKGEWDDGSPRTFDQICGGRLKYPDGWIPLHDLHKTFRQVSRGVWEAQQQCLRPSTEGLVVPQFDRHRHGIRWYRPDPANGPIYQSTDFGGTNPHAASWYQVLTRDIKVHGYTQRRDEEPTKELKAGTRVCFAEVYQAEIGNNKLAALIHAKEAGIKRVWSNFRVRARFADPQAKAARLDFAKHDPPLRTIWTCTRDVKEHVKTVVELVQESRFFVDVDECPFFCNEIESWHYPDKRSGFVDDPEIPVDDFDHCMSNFRYAMENIKVLERKAGVGMSQPTAGPVTHVTAQADGYRYASSGSR